MPIKSALATPSPTPVNFEHQRQRIERRLQTLHQRSDVYSWIRVGVVLAGVAMIYPLIFLVNVWAVGAWLGLVAIVFGVVVNIHRHIQEAIRQLEIWAGIKRTHQARLALDWSALPPSTFIPNPQHPFENDFDITGDYSLHRLI